MENLKIRTKKYALRIIKLFISLPKTPEAQIIGKQILRSGTSVGANYSESYRARSDNEFVAKINIALQELEETLYWLELILEGKISDSTEEIKFLQKETDELIAIFVTIINKINKGRRMKVQGRRMKDEG
ncbi:MAG: four helix bundle protein [Candidatus Firestonebacteria bacterium]|nr:four helix bundle protein [Candidatus Firestonebacteria bacterium]